MTLEWHYSENEQEYTAQAGAARLRVSLREDGLWMPSVDLVGLEIGPPFEQVPDAQAWAIEAACKKVQPLIDQARATAVAKEREECAAVLDAKAAKIAETILAIRASAGEYADWDAISDQLKALRRDEEHAQASAKAIRARGKDGAK